MFGETIDTQQMNTEVGESVRERRENGEGGAKWTQEKFSVRSRIYEISIHGECPFWYGGGRGSEGQCQERCKRPSVDK